MSSITRVVTQMSNMIKNSRAASVCIMRTGTSPLSRSISVMDVRAFGTGRLSSKDQIAELCDQLQRVAREKEEAHFHLNMALQELNNSHMEIAQIKGKMHEQQELIKKVSMLLRKFVTEKKQKT